MVELRGLTSRMLIEDILKEGAVFLEKLKILKSSLNSPFPWYPYNTLSNLWHLDTILKSPYRDLDSFVLKEPILDIGCADGELGFFLESLGHCVNFLDYGPTNYNTLRGLRALHTALKSSSTITELDIDSQFTLPRNYGLCLCLGLLYHIKNPFFLLETIAKHSTYCLLSTRVFQVTKDKRVRAGDSPIVYLVAPEETNNDPTNFWIFSEAGLKRIIARTGWEILSWGSVGNSHESDPSSPERDERVFCLLKSTLATV